MFKGRDSVVLSVGVVALVSQLIISAGKSTLLAAEFFAWLFGLAWTTPRREFYPSYGFRLGAAHFDI